MSDVGLSTPDPGGASRQPLVVRDDTGWSGVVAGWAGLGQGIQGMQAESRVTVRGRPTLSGWQAYCQLWEQDHRLSSTGSRAADGGCCGFAPGPEAPWCWVTEPLIGNFGNRGHRSRDTMSSQPPSLAQGQGSFAGVTCATSQPNQSPHRWL